MSDNDLIRSRPHLSVGTIGHFGHGKTTLAAALSKVLQKNQGGLNKALSITDIAKGGFVRNKPSGWLKSVNPYLTVEANRLFYESPQRYYGHIDLPGRVEFYKNMASGASQIDAAILVISVEESVMPQTREYLLLARQAGAKQFVVFLNKCDLVDDESLLDLAEEEARALLTECGLPGDSVPVLRGAALPAYNEDPRWEATILSVAQALDTELPQPERLIDAPVLLEIEKVYSIGGKGTVVAGRLSRGTIRRGDTVEAIGKGIEKPVLARVVDIEVFCKKVDEGVAGDIVGLLIELPKKPVTLLHRGHILCTEGTALLRKRFSAEAYALSTEEGGRHTPFFEGHRVQFYMGADNIQGQIKLSQNYLGIAPGQSFTMEVTLQRPALIEAGRQFIFRDGCDGLRRLHGGPRAWGGTAGHGSITKALDGE